MIRVSKYFLTLIVAVNMFLLAPNAWVWPKQCFAQEKSGRGEVFESISQELGLSSEQKDELVRIRESSRAKMKNILKALKEQRGKLREELGKPEIDEVNLDNIVIKIKQLQAELIDQRIENILAIRQVFTPEQFTQFKDKLKEFKGKFGLKGGRE